MSVVAIPVQLQNFSLSGSGCSIGDTVLNLKSFKDILGVNLAIASFGSTGYGTIEPGNGVQEEQISFTGITQNSDGTAQLTGVKHVIFKSPFTETSGVTITHPGSTVFIVSNTSGYENAIYSYINAAIASGGVPATRAQQGITALTQDPASLGSPIAIGANTSLSGNTVSTANPVVDQSGISSVISVGAIVAYGATGTPTGYIRTDGSAVSRTGSNAALFSTLGTAYGAGNGSTTFNIPSSFRSIGGYLFDSSSNLVSTSSSPATWNHTINSGLGASGMLVVGTIAVNGSPSAVPTYNGVNMTQAATVTSGGDTVFTVYYLLNPASGTHAISASFTGDLGGVAASYFPLATSSTLDTTVSTGITTGTTLTTTLSPAATAGLLVFVGGSNADQSAAVPTLSNTVIRALSVGSGKRTLVIGDASPGLNLSVYTQSTSNRVGLIGCSFISQGSKFVLTDLIKL